MFGHFPGSRVSVRVVVAPEDKRKQTNAPHFLLLPLAFILSRRHMVWNIPLVSLGQLSWLCPLPRSCPPPAYWWGGNVGETALMLWEHCFSSSQNTGVLSTLF